MVGTLREGEAERQPRRRRAGGVLWRFLGLFAAGLVWAGPLVSISFASSTPGVALHPALAARLETVRLPVLVAVPFVAILGVAVVGWLCDARPLVRRRVVLAIAALCLVFWAIAMLESARIYPDRAFLRFAGTWYALCVLVLLLGLVGLAATVIVLWRRRWWLSLVWLLLWGSVSGVVLIGSQQTADSEDYGGGVMVALTGALLVLTALVAAAVVTALVEARSHPAHRTSASSRPAARAT